MEAWRYVWRHGIAPAMSTAALEALAGGLELGDERITQGSTTVPPPMACVSAWPVEGACAIGYAGWHGEGLGQVGEVEQYFASVCSQADALLGEEAACRHFLNWFDDTPRQQMIGELLAEVRLALAQRQAVEAIVNTSGTHQRRSMQTGLEAA